MHPSISPIPLLDGPKPKKMKIESPEANNQTPKESTLAQKLKPEPNHIIPTSHGGNPTPPAAALGNPTPPSNPPPPPRPVSSTSGGNLLADKEGRILPGVPNHHSVGGGGRGGDFGEVMPAMDDNLDVSSYIV